MSKKHYSADPVDSNEAAEPVQENLNDTLGLDSELDANAPKEAGDVKAKETDTVKPLTLAENDRFVELQAKKGNNTASDAEVTEFNELSARKDAVGIDTASGNYTQTFTTGPGAYTTKTFTTDGQEVSSYSVDAKGNITGDAPEEVRKAIEVSNKNLEAKKSA